MTDLLQAATVYLNAGLALLPIDHTTKRPLMRLLPRDAEGNPTWEPLRENPADLNQVNRWLAGGVKAIGVIAGRTSILVLDFDELRFYEAWIESVGELAANLPTQITGGGGRQVFCRCPESGANTKLAWVADDTKEDGRRIAIETRAGNGYAVLSPSLHPTGNYYQMMPGSTLAEIPMLSQAHADALLAAARKLDEMPYTKQEHSRRLAEALKSHQRKLAQSNGHKDVIGEFNKAHSVESFLEGHGYVRDFGNRFKRPQGKSGSVIVEGGRSVHFSSNDPLNDGRVSSGCGVHDAFDLYCHFDHAGDVSAAVKAAADLLGIKKHSSRVVSRQPVLVCMASVEAQPVKWLWPGRIPEKRISLIVGRPGEGKSMLAIDMAARITTGTPWPDGSQCPAGSVILISTEDDPADTIRPRLDAHRADVSRVHLLSAVRRTSSDGTESELMFTLADVEALRKALEQISDCRAVIVDPIGSFIGGDIDAHRDNEVRAVLDPIKTLAEQFGPAVIIVQHRRKSAGNIADDLALGSRAFTGIARAVWHLSRDPDNKNRRLLLPGKNNLAPEGTGLAFTIGGDPACISWERGAVEMNADDQLAIENAGPEKPGPEPVKQDAAKEWLSELLAGGPLPIGDKENPVPGTIRAEAAEAGQAWGTVRRAGDKLGLVKERCQFTKKYQWRLAKQGAKDGCADPLRENNLRNLRNLKEPQENQALTEGEEVGCAGSNNMGNQDGEEDFNPDA